MSSSKECSRKAGKRGQGSIRRTRLGHYEYRISYTDPYGQRRSKSFTCPTIDECVDRAELFRKQLEENYQGIRYEDTVGEILRRKAKSDFDKNYCGEQGYSRNLDTIAILERIGIGKMRIIDVTPYHIDLFLREVTGYANGTIRKVHSMLCNAFKLACEAGVIRNNLMNTRDARCPKSSKKDKLVRGLTEGEQKRFLEALENHKVPYGRNSYKQQLLIELYSGLRMGEINALKPEDIDFDAGVVHVTSTVSVGLEGRLFIKEGAKTDAGSRDVPMNRNLREVLHEAMDNMRSNPEGLLFYDYNKGGPISTLQVNAFFKRICEKAAVPYWGQHSLRHTFATRCIEAGIAPVVLKKWLGHTNIHITLDTYADVFDRMHNDSVDKFDELMDRL